MAKKMADKKREDRTGTESYKLWQDRIKRAHKLREKSWNGDKKWLRMLRLVRGDHWSITDAYDDINPTSEEPRDRITVNKVGSLVDDFLAFLVARPPTFSG